MTMRLMQDAEENPAKVLRVKTAPQLGRFGREENCAIHFSPKRVFPCKGRMKVTDNFREINYDERKKVNGNTYALQLHTLC